MEMERLVSLCKRRGFVYPSSEIYGGLNGFWDYGPLGVELKRNVKECWWRDMVTGHDDTQVPAGAPEAWQMVGLDSTIIMHPRVWKSSGHYDLFHDHMVDCRESKRRYRYDQVRGRWVEHRGRRVFVSVYGDAVDPEQESEQRALKFFGLRSKQADQLVWHGGVVALPEVDDPAAVLGPDAKALGTLTEPREFNLMFKTVVGALGGEEDAAFLRPETAQGIFVNFKNVVDTSRVRVPFGIAQIGKSFRNEITPRNFTFRSREFEQMEIEFFCHPSRSAEWYRYWRDRRYRWYLDLGLSEGRLRLREHEAAELAHYSVGTADLEYAFPFLPDGEYGELEGVAHRADFDLRSHTEGKLVKDGDQLVVEQNADGTPRHKGSGRDLRFLDEQSKEKFFPHVVEPSAGVDRGTLAFLCEAYSEDEVGGEARTVLRFHPRIAPIKAAVFALIDKDPAQREVALGLYRGLKAEGIACAYDDKGNIGRRYRRQDEAGTPFCFTVDEVTAQDGTVTLRDRDSLEQHRIRADDVVDEVRRRIRP